MTPRFSKRRAERRPTASTRRQTPFEWQLKYPNLPLSVAEKAMNAV
jgi:hypothetical protein